VPDFRPILFILGSLMLALALAMLLPAAVESLQHEQGWRSFLVSALITGGAGGALMLGYRQPKRPALTPRQSFILVTAAWVVLCAFATLPLMLSAPHLSFTDAYFEAMSGLTTTGSTVIVGLADQPQGLLLWRAMLQWIGGIGIIGLAVAVLPVLRVGGMQLFRMESSDKSEKVRPRVSQVTWILISVYVTLTAICAIALLFAGMSPFDAVCHAMTTLATGGFSTQDASVGFYRSSAIEWIITLFMALGGCTFVLLARLAQGDIRAFVNDSQTRWYFAYLIGFIALIALWQVAVNDRPIMEAVRSTAFNVVSVATTTGFATEDYTLWGSLPVAAFMALYFIGGCTGSTSGSMKVFRFCVLGAVALWQIRLLVHPHRMRPPTYNGKPVSEDVVRSVLSFFAFYIFCFAVLSVAVSAFDVDLVTSLSGVAQAMANTGPGLGPIIGPAGNFVPLHDGAKWLLSLAMLLGRLELLTVLVMLSPVFWRG
jgi:trk system potassium uptake protein TrkH